MVVSIGADVQAELESTKAKVRFLEKENKELKKSVAGLEVETKCLREHINGICGLCNRQSKGHHDRLQERVGDIHREICGKMDQIELSLSVQQDIRQERFEKIEARLDRLFGGLLNGVTGISPSANAAVCLSFYRELMEIHQGVSLRFGDISEQISFHENVLEQMHDDIVELDAGRRIAGFPRVPQ